ncbi:monovalent cation/H+ antiporter complex subunit F [Longibacter sp.]|jgi:multicomponent Na+:H+ antiporter subunit F|uniref:monovalent cation/H+ antiporter complex subunit F n=1 Tax=Longibacter sp. TaxID=2045415 RepID=UPI003EBAC97E
MTLIDLTLIEWVVYITLAVLSLAIGAAFIRVLRGPSLPDRVIALDLVAYLAMGFLGAYAVLSEQETYIDAALVLGLLAFLGTVAVARYIERVESNESQTES